MEALFLKIVNMSLTASWLALAVILFRAVFRKAPKWMNCLQWGLVALRLICPFSIESALSLIPSAEPLPEEIIYTAQPQIESGIGSVDGFVNPILDAALKADGLTSANATQIWSFIFSQIWILGMALMVLYAGISYLLLRRKVATATLYVQKETSKKTSSRIKQCDRIDSPFILGIIRPTIYLPYQIAEEDLEYVIAHEQAHIRRKDHWWKPLGYLLLILHWFNPLLWISYILLCRDIEAACDEKVIGEMKKEERRAYSTALLNCSVHRRSIAACPLAFGEVGVKERIKRVMNYKKPAFWLIMITTVTAVLVSMFFLTNPKSSNTEVMGAEYKIKEVLYSASIPEKSDGTANQMYAGKSSLYCLTADYHLFFLQSEEADTIYLGKMEPYELTKQELESYMPEKAQRRNHTIHKITDSYIVRMENQAFYLVFQTTKGRTYLASGWEDVYERGQGASDDTRLEALYLLNNGFEKNTFYQGFFNRTLMMASGHGVEAFEYMVSDDFPGYAVVGFKADGAPYSLADLGYGGEYVNHYLTDMGFAVFKISDDYRYKLLDYHIYENAAIEDDGIYYGEHPAVMNETGVLEIDETFDVILSCNDQLSEIQRVYQYGREEDGEKVRKEFHNVTIENNPSVTLFSWALEEEADSVSQYYIGKGGYQLGNQVLKNAHMNVGIGKQLTLEDVIRLSEKGMDLSWEDFEEYSYYETGSGLYIQVYEIDDQFRVAIGGTYPFTQENPDKKEYTEKPMYIYLSANNSETGSIDIRKDDVEAYIEAHREQPLEKAIRAAILSHNMTSTYQPDSNYHCADFLLLGTEQVSGTPLEGKNNHMAYATFYGIAMYQKFKLSEDGRSFEEAGGSHIPVAITFKVKDESYELYDYWTPGDGADYTKDIRERFPDELEEKAFDTSPYVTAQMQNCYRQFLLDNQTFYEGDMIEKLLDTIQSSPRESSNPNDYIASHVKEFRRLTYFGAYVLEYYFRQFENSERIDEPGWELREHIMARSCVEIAHSYGEMVINDDTVILDGQEWYQQFKQNAYALQGQYREEELKEKYYASWILLEFLEMYYGLYPYSET